MNKLFILIFIAALSIPLLFNSCANVKAPTGGPRDTIPPELVRSNPETQTINFDGNSIQLEFNEFIKVDKIKTQLVITPRLDKEYKVKEINKRVELQFPEDNPFAENTTYTFNFENVIKDLTEGNAWQDAKIVFSTGPELDSLTIQGTVKDLLTQQLLKNATVALYNAQDTLGPLTDKPMYFGKTDENGEYLLENLAPLSYNIYAIQDQNNNLIIDPGKEKYGFFADTINLKESIDGVNLQTFALNLNELILLSARSVRDYFDFTFNKYVLDYQLVTPEDSLKLYSNFQDDHKKIRVYNTIQTDSVQTIITAQDSLGNQVVDTLYVKFQESRLPPEPFNASIEPKNNQTVSRNFTGVIKFNKPVWKINDDSLFFIYDSVRFDQLTVENFSFNKYRDEVYIDKTLTFPDSLLSSNNKNFNFYIGEASFISAANDSSKTMNLKYSLLDPVNYGTIKGSVVTDNESFIIQLLDTKYQPVREIRNERTFTFNLVPQGTYMIRVLVDNNNNGEWDPGILTENRMPEQVVYYQSGEEKNFSVKANWELTDLIIEIPPYLQ